MGGEGLSGAGEVGGADQSGWSIRERVGLGKWEEHGEWEGHG